MITTRPSHNTSESEKDKTFFLSNPSVGKNKSQRLDAIKNKYLIKDVFTAINNFFYTHFTTQGRLELKEVKLIDKINTSHDKIKMILEKIHTLTDRLDTFIDDFEERKPEYFDSKEGIFRFSQYRNVVEKFESVVNQFEVQKKSQELLEKEFKVHRLKHYGVHIVNESLKQFKRSLDLVEGKFFLPDIKINQAGEFDLKKLIDSFVDFNHEFDAIIEKYPQYQKGVNQFMSRVYKLNELRDEKRKLQKDEELLKSKISEKQQYMAEKTQEANKTKWAEEKYDHEIKNLEESIKSIKHTLDHIQEVLQGGSEVNADNLIDVMEEILNK